MENKRKELIKLSHISHSIVVVGCFCLLYFWCVMNTNFDIMQNAVEQPPKFVGRWAGSFTINIFVVVWVLIVGFGFGGWASMTNFIHQIDTFGLFTKCYQCPPPPGSPPPFLPHVGAPRPSPANITHHHHL